MHETRLPVEGQLIQMLSDLQKQLDEQRAETIRKGEKAALERDTEARVQDQLITQIEIL